VNAEFADFCATMIDRYSAHILTGASPAGPSAKPAASAMLVS
jgi:hypothetical protein